MDLEIQRERGEIINVYRMLRYNPLSYLVRVAALGVILFFVIGVTYDMLFDPSLGRDFTPQGFAKWERSAALSLLAAAALSAWYCSRTRIVVRKNGLEIHLIFNDIFKYRPHTFSTWENLSHIELVEEGTTEGSNYHRMLCLRNPEKRVNIGGIIYIHFQHYHTGRWFGKHEYTIINSDRLLLSRFGQDLLKYAPHVIEAAKQETLNMERLVQSDNAKRQA
jgi:hypothetical protein